MTATQEQIGGDHYKLFPIQPIEFIHKNQIPFLEANVIKYICRWRHKNGKQDLEKAKHYIDLLMEMEFTCDDCGCVYHEWDDECPVCSGELE